MNVRRTYCVFKCENLYQLNVPLHRFPHPMKHPEWFAAWMSVAGDKVNQTDPMLIYKYKRICDYHFDPAEKLASNRLKRLAVPSVNLKCVQLSNVGIVYLDHTYSERIRDLNLLPVGFPSGSCPTSQPIPNPTAVESTNTADDYVQEDSFMDENTTAATHNSCYGNDDDNFNDAVPDTPMPEFEESPRGFFSWEKSDTIVADDTMIVSDFTMAGSELTLDYGDISMYNDEQYSKVSKDAQKSSEILDYMCNRCGEQITGFRYTCVQCADWDLCAACEARAAHDAHYVLRVPRERPYKEVQAMLTVVRQQLLSENLGLAELAASIKEELIDEDAEVPDCTPNSESDPLQAWDMSHHDDLSRQLKNNPEPNENGHPPRKRRRRRFDSNTQNLTPRDDSYNQVTQTDNDPIATTDDLQSNDAQVKSSLEYTEAIKIIDVDKLTRTHEDARQDLEQNDSDVIQIAKENGIEMLEDTSDEILDTSKSQPQHELEKLVDIRNETPNLTFKNKSHLNHETDNEQLSTQNKEIATRITAIAGLNADTEAHRQTKTRTHRERMATRSIAKTRRKSTQRYTIFLPPGDEWKQLLMSTLTSQVTVQLEDTLRNMELRRISETNKKSEINDVQSAA